MWTTLALTMTLSVMPGEAGELRLSNIRPTNGLLGSERPDSKLLPGDIFFVTFDIDGLKVDSKSGSMYYTMAMEVRGKDRKGNDTIVYKSDPQDLDAPVPLGGLSLPGFAHVDLGRDMPPGEYTLKVTVTDKATRAPKFFEKKFEVLRPTFGLIQLKITYDKDGQMPAPHIGVAGQSFWVNFNAVNFERAADTKNPDVTFEMFVLDERGKRTLDIPIGGSIDDLPREFSYAPTQFFLPLNRAGKFTVKLKATDNIGKKTAELSFPITVYDSK
jgi:hypothetical protein